MTFEFTLGCTYILYILKVSGHDISPGSFITWLYPQTTHILRDPGRICMTNILTHKFWFLCSRDLVGWEKLGQWLWISQIFSYWPLFNIFSHRVHQLPNYLPEYIAVAYQWMQNDERALENYISIISVHENREVNAKTNFSIWTFHNVWANEKL